MWESGDLLPSSFPDLLLNETSNETLCEFLRGKIRSIAKDPVTAEALCPKDHYYGTKRPCPDSGYYETFNLPHVRLVDLRATPITSITEDGIETSAATMPFDAIVFATGFDATGAVVAVDIRGRDGLAMADKWAEGPRNYLGIMSAGFPNLFTITGPGSPSVLSNMAVSIEQHVEWITDCMRHMRETNVPGKPRVFLPYVGGVDTYRRICGEVVSRGYLGFSFDGPAGRRCEDGVICRLQPDVQLMLAMIGRLGLPPMESLDVEGARAMSRSLAAVRPPGPAVGALVDGVLPGAAGDLGYRLYRPASPGPHPLVVYFHGGGWVRGGADSDDPFCRDLAVRSNAAVISVDYRHAPEARFPAAVDDAFAAVQWIASHAEDAGRAGSTRESPSRPSRCPPPSGHALTLAVVGQVEPQVPRPVLQERDGDRRLAGDLVRLSARLVQLSTPGCRE